MMVSFLFLSAFMILCDQIWLYTFSLWKELSFPDPGLNLTWQHVDSCRAPKLRVTSVYFILCGTVLNSILVCIRCWNESVITGTVRTWVTVLFPAHVHVVWAGAASLPVTSSVACGIYWKIQSLENTSL